MWPGGRSPLYVGVVHAAVIQVVAERGDQQRQDLQVGQLVLRVSGRREAVRACAASPGPTLREAACRHLQQGTTVPLKQEPRSLKSSDLSTPRNYHFGGFWGRTPEPAKG